MSTTRLRKLSSLAMVSALVAGAVSVVGVTSATPAVAATKTEVKTYAATVTAYTDKKNPTKSYHKVATDKLSKSQYQAFAKFAKVPLAANQRITAISLVVRPTGGATSSTGVVAAPVKWSGSKITYKTKPKAGAALNSPVKATKGKDCVVPLKSSVFSTAASSAGLALQLTHSKSDTTVNIAGTGTYVPKIRVTIVTTVPDPVTPLTGRITTVPATLTSTSGAVQYPAASADLGEPVIPPASAGKKVFAHYMPNFPLSIENKPASSDYYATEYLTATPKWETQHIPYKGYVRDRPIGVAVKPASTYILDNSKIEIAQAKAAGIDGFAIDILSLDQTSDLYKREMAMLEAASQTGFVVMPQLDMDSLAKATDDQIASFLVRMAKSFPAGIYKDANQKMVVSTFRAENRSVSWWRTTLGKVNAAGVATSFMPLFLEWGARNSDWDSISDGYSVWGGRSVGHIWSGAADAHAAKKKWMQPVAAQDARHGTSHFDEQRGVWVASDETYYEAGNSDTLRDAWAQAIGTNANNSADIVLLTTWNDYRESSEVAPSVYHGYSLLDISTPFIARFKSGAFPDRFAHEAVILSHRNQLTSAPVNQQIRTYLRPLNVTVDNRNQIEVLTMLNSPAQVKLSVGGKAYTINAPAGIGVAKVALETGVKVSAAASRNGVTFATVATNERVEAVPSRQDLTYRFASSARPLPVRP